MASELVGGDGARPRQGGWSPSCGSPARGWRLRQGARHWHRAQLPPGCCVKLGQHWPLSGGQRFGEHGPDCPEGLALCPGSAPGCGHKSLSLRGAHSQGGASSLPPPHLLCRGKPGGQKGFIQLLPLLKQVRCIKRTRQFLPHPGNGCPARSPEKSQDRKVKLPPSPDGRTCPQLIFLNATECSCPTMAPRGQSAGRAAFTRQQGRTQASVSGPGRWAGPETHSQPLPWPDSTSPPLLDHFALKLPRPLGHPLGWLSAGHL